MDTDNSNYNSDNSSSSRRSSSSSYISSSNSINTNKPPPNTKKKNKSNKSASIHNNNKNRIKNSPSPPQLKSKSSRSKLAQEHKITAAQEQEIQEVFLLFARESSSITTTSTNKSLSFQQQQQQTKKKERKSKQKQNQDLSSTLRTTRLQVNNLRRALTALSLTPTKSELKEYIEILDQDGVGLVEYEPFVAICALKINSRAVSDLDHQRELDEAWSLFVKEGEDRITLASLREVARAIGEKGISDELLMDMVLEANEGAGLAKGVDKREFENVMRKAGVW